MSKLIDLTGLKFAKLLVVERHGLDKTGKTTWLVRCDCGNVTFATALNLKSGNTKSCGCLKHRLGDLNPKFKPVSKADLLFRKRNTGGFKQWRRSVIERCPVCIRCGDEKNLHAHHLIGAYEHPSSQYDPLNGITLCSNCHMDFHCKYGRRGGFSEDDAKIFVDSEIAWLVTRYRAKNGVEDLKKARHFLDLLIEMEGEKK